MALRHPDSNEEGGGGGKVEEEKGMEWERERKKKKKKMGKEGSRDPLEVFGMDLMLRILIKLDAHSVALSSLVSRRWHLVASSDPLWSLKVTPIPFHFVELSCSSCLPCSVAFA